MSSKRPRKSATKPKRMSTVKRRATTPLKRPRHVGSDEDSDDSEKEIETLKDYEDAVRRRILSSTTGRYEDAFDQDQMAYAAALMMQPSDLQSDVQGVEQPTNRVVYSLGTFCLHAIVSHFKYLAADAASPIDDVQQRRQCKGHRRHSGAHFRKQIQRLPYYLSTKLFKFLKHARPELLSTKIWTSLFFPCEQVNSIESLNGGGGAAGLYRGNTLFLTELDLEGLVPSQVTDSIIQRYFLQTLDIGPQLERINLNHLDSLSDKAVAQLVRTCTQLARLSLKGCTKVGDLTLANLPKESLQELNISFVGAPTTKGIKQLIYDCRELKVLKMAGLVNIKDVLFLDLEKDLAAQLDHRRDHQERHVQEVGGPQEPLPLHRLQNLKISTTQLGDRGLKVLLGLCGRSLRRLDISATNVTRVAIIAQFCTWEESSQQDVRHGDAAATNTSHPCAGSASRTLLEKLNLTRLKIASRTDFLMLFQRLPPYSLHTLLMGYLTCGQVPIRDDLVHQLCPFLEPDIDKNDLPNDVRQETTLQPAYFPDPFAPALDIRPEFHIHTLSLFGNPQIGLSRQRDHDLHLLLRRLAPFLKRLELGYTKCKASVLEGLLENSSDAVPSNMLALHSGDDELADNFILQELGLDETLMDDQAATVLSHFQRLNRLSLVNTRIGMEAVEKVVRACPMLTNLDLSSCRGIPLLHRRTLLKDVRQTVAVEVAEAAEANGSSGDGRGGRDCRES
ncbi:hypothetical protein BGZ51_006548 [Haplosporangium sp. Z 767]|nr:hypothetical protein BGZ50_008901 [Haplosporangium sp. Z 11]KAF9179938.1 hypothetical protein BGZ51_006548 [Haplosporangium sp. Z 767]